MERKRRPEMAAKSIIRKEDKFDNSKYWIETGIDLEQRKIMIDETIDEYSTGWVIRAIHKMLEINSEDPIDIYINSFGGSVYDGFALYDTIINCDKTTIRTHALGKIMSMALIIFLAGDERDATENATFMAHAISSYTWGKLYELDIETNECKRLEENTLKIMADRTGQSYSYWKRQLKYEDRYYDKDKAKELGIITEGEDE